MTCIGRYAIPPTAKVIKVTSILSPYIIRAYEVENHVEKNNRINAQLCNFINKHDFSKKRNNTEQPKVNDVVLVQSSHHKNGVAELPSYLCRGLITYIREENSRYNILLLDYGINIELSTDEFHIVPKNFISEKYLIKTIGTYNVLPICMQKNLSYEHRSTTMVVEEWSKEAIQFTKHLLMAAEVIYFDCLVTNEKNGREYGEIYLIIDDIIRPLSEALVISYYAIYLEEDLLQCQLIEMPSLMECKGNIKENIIIRTKFLSNSQRIYVADEVDNLYHLRHSEKVLIQSMTSCKILSNVNDLGFPKEVHKGWNKYIKSSRPRKLQSYVWPSIKKRLNVVAIGPAQCGKTTGCVMAVCGLTVMRQKMLSSNATHPMALILCSSSFEVINVHSLCDKFLQNSENVTSVAAFNGRTYRSVAAAIYSGCQILVTTSRYLVRFLNENKGLLSFEKLSCLVLDNADIILDNYYTSIGELFKKYKIIENRELHDDNRPLLQIILLATHWTSNIKKFVSLMYNPFICVTSFVEAVVFKSVRPTMYVMKSSQKNQKISDILENDYTTRRTMVVCVNAEEANKLNTFLFSTKKTLLIHEKLTSFDILALHENWKTCVHGLYPVLICTDAVLSQLDCTNIQWLIHHSVLMTFKNQFNYRFSVLLDNLALNATKCKISIIIDENNNVQFPSILKVMQRMNVVISPELLEYIEHIAITLEKDKNNYDICDNVKSLGFCSNQSTCVFRHCILPEIDVPMTDIQINDKVQLNVLYIHDTTHFSARLIGHIPHSSNSKNKEFSSVEYMQVTLKMQEYYQNIENRKMCASTNVGDVCVLEESMGIFKRVKIRRIRYDRATSEDVKYVDVRCIDSGVIHECIDVRKLIHISKELLNLPTHVVEIFLNGIAPYDEESMWNYYSEEMVHNWFVENLDNRSYVIGKVRLHIGNTLWLDDLKVGTKLLNHSDLIGSSLKQKLIAEEHAIPNNDHMRHLMKLCKKSGLSNINGHDINTLCK